MEVKAYCAEAYKIGNAIDPEREAKIPDLFKEVEEYKDTILTKIEKLLGKTISKFERKQCKELTEESKKNGNGIMWLLGSVGCIIEVD